MAWLLKEEISSEMICVQMAVRVVELAKKNTVLSPR